MIKKFKIADLYTGQQFTFSKIISRELITEFSSMTGDYHPLHTDYDYSLKSGFNNIIAQGFLLISFFVLCRWDGVTRRECAYTVTGIKVYPTCFY